jgi:DNA-directed RNA polymerase specialized sigma24 family protein
LATGAAQGGARRSEPGTDARVSRLVARHERSLLRVARHWSLCRDDALDAYQRALEIYVRRLDSLDPATELAWLRVVTYRNLGTPGSAVPRPRRGGAAIS